MVIVFAVTATEWAGLLGAAAAIVTAGVGGYAAWSRRREEREHEEREREDGTVVIRQAQGANTILDASVRALNTVIEGLQSSLDRERERRIECEASEQAVRQELAQVREELRDCQEDRAS